MSLLHTLEYSVYRTQLTWNLLSVSMWSCNILVLSFSCVQFWPGLLPNGNRKNILSHRPPFIIPPTLTFVLEQFSPTCVRWYASTNLDLRALVILAGHEKSKIVLFTSVSHHRSLVEGYTFYEDTRQLVLCP